ncbi:MAG: HNH endonuclease [Dysgonomonas sp.]
MARIRTIKPEFWEDEKVGMLSHGARLLFLGILNFGDDEGLIRWNPMYLGASIFPYDEIKSDTIEKWMTELIDNELIYVYQAGQVRQKLGHVINFLKHQRIDKPQPSKFPPPNPSDVKVKEMIAKRDYYRCHLCGELVDMNARTDVCKSKAPSVDHIKPKNKGGTDFFSNLKISHLSCNQSKGDRYETKSGKDSKNNSENDSKNSSNNDSTTEWNGMDSKGNKKEIPSNEGIKKETDVSSSTPQTDYEKFNDWIKKKAPYCSNPKNFTSQITEEEFLKLKNHYKYTGKQIADVILQIENRKDLRKRYTNLYRTVLNWADKEYGKNEKQKPDTPAVIG